MAYEYVYKRRRMLAYHRYSIPQGATKIRKVDARSKKYAYLKSSRYGFLIMKRKRRLYKNKNQSQRKAVMTKYRKSFINKCSPLSKPVPLTINRRYRNESYSLEYTTNSEKEALKACKLFINPPAGKKYARKPKLFPVIVDGKRKIGIYTKL